MADLTKLKGAHTLKMGVDFRLFRTWAVRYPTAVAPDLSVANTYTRGPLDNSTTINSSFGIATQAVSEPRNWQFAMRLTF